MLCPIILLLLLSALPVLVSSIYCYSCPQLLVLNYPVTSETVPSFSDCQLINATQCLITVIWNENMNITAIDVDSRNSSSKINVAEDIITPMTLMEIGPDEETPLLAHSLFFSCMSSDKCNDEMSLRKILRSLVIEDQFRQELYPLIKIVSSFDAKSAACFNFTNTTTYCPPTDLNICRRCQISVDELLSFHEEICATCPQSRDNANAVLHSKTFLLNNQTQLADHVQLDCQLNGCNSIENINRVYTASKITFDFGEFMK